MNKYLLSSVMIPEAEKQMPNETGGCLLGYLDTNKNLVITNVIGPGPNAIHNQHYFKPDNKWQTHAIEKIYKQSGRLHTYLGDWHIHTLPNNLLSPQDKRTLRHIGSYRPARVKFPIMGILLFSFEWEITFWQLKTKRLFSFLDKSKYEKLELRYY